MTDCRCRFEGCRVCRGLHGSLPPTSMLAVVEAKYKGHWVPVCEPCSVQWTARPDVGFRSLSEERHQHEKGAGA